MNKYRYPMNAIIVLIMSVGFSYQWIIRFDFSYSIVNFINTKPFVYRVLIPILARIIMFATRLAPEIALALMIFLSCLLCYAAIVLLFRQYMSIENVPLYSLTTFAVVYLYLLMFANHYDFMSVALVCISIYLLSTDRRDIYYILFPVIALHRWEICFLAGFVFALYEYKRMDFKRYVMAGLYQVSVLAVIIWLLVSAFADKQGSTYAAVFVNKVVPAYMSDPLILSFLLFVIVCTFVVVRKKWDLLSPVLQVSIFIVPLQFVLHLIFGNPYEFRVMGEVIPVYLLVLLL